MLASACAPASGSGQVSAEGQSADHVLARLSSGDPEQFSQATRTIGSAFRGEYARYSNTHRRLLLDGLQRLAGGAGAGGDEVANRRSTIASFSLLRSIATDSIAIPEDREIPQRVLRIYRESSRIESQGMALFLLGKLMASYSDDRPAIEALLVSIASADFSPGKVHPQTAVDALMEGGDAGVAVLRRLHEDGSVRNPEVSIFLRELARDGYRRN